ncbi:capsule assembly Wzi family protein [Cyclobacterium roseum]|uniref:capsule assembly Wzi family protein n=1 Tax=Cyclobacterium roseum TaxID=2666137 RepID=UPI001391CAF5|nr:capsule assembly Wzi family protein [Cyclobacterium roseum]
MIYRSLLILLFFLINGAKNYGQELNSNNSIFNELARRDALLSDEVDQINSFSLRPFPFNVDSVVNNSEPVRLDPIPVFSVNKFNSNRPYGWGDFGLTSSVGIQNYISSGLTAKLYLFNIDFQPEFIYVQNKSYFGFPDDFPEIVNQDRFLFYNHGDYPELFGEGPFYRFWWGQSKITFSLGPIETGLSTKSIWWGPGQWNSLTFSNNSQSFPHLTMKTATPINTFVGEFQSQLLLGRLNDSGFAPTQHDELNNKYFRNFSGDWRYLNALLISYSPKWIPGLSVGFTRTFQQYNENRDNSFRSIFPIFEAFQKKKFFENGNSVAYDNLAMDQQATVFGRFMSQKAKGEIYFEYGRRDHAYNFKEAILNPEHARAFIFGFKKLFTVPGIEDYFLQFRGEITQQQQSINRIMRYFGAGGGSTWHTHYQVRGFANYGQALGVGIGTGSNIQSFEVGLVDKFDKIGLLFERLENHQDFFYRSLYSSEENKPWVDLSIGFLFDKRWDQFLLSSKVQLINGRNYQWQLDPNSTPEFPKGKHLFSVHSQVSLIYLFQKNQQLNP